jgi:hypothetical protein
MNKQHFITITLVISGLAFTPIIADSEFNRITHSQNVSHTVAANISSILYNRGIDADAADDLSINFVNEEDELFLTMMIQALDERNIVSREEVLEYLSTAALHKQNIDFKKYDNLIGMVSTIKQEALDTSTLKQLSNIAKINKQLFV